MKIGEIMSRLIHTIEPGATIGDAAQIMGLFDIGILPVVEDGGELVGVVTDRDLVVHAMAEGLHSRTSVAQIMTTDVSVCHEDDELMAVLHEMGAEQIRRMPVCSKQEKLVGMVSLADFARQEIARDDVGAALRGICRAHGCRSQRLRAA